jgi:hypothetical protein
MGLMGKLKVVLVNKKTNPKKEREDEREDDRFHRPGRMDRSIENGKEYRSLSYDETRPIDDLLPDEAKKQETSVLSKQLDYALMINFDAPIPKTP